MNISEENYIKFLSFTIQYEYSKFEIINIINFIPFRFFNITRTNDKYIIDTAFPLINEILDDIYRYIIVKKSYNAFKILSNNKGSAFSSLFEYKVRYNFSPQVKNEIKYFTNFIIHENIRMEVIIPKKNQKNDPVFIRELELHKNYLVEQKQFGRKDLDFLIIHMSEIPEVFGFQVSTYKETIFTSLVNTFNILIDRLKLSFNVNINEAYFGYIFDYSRLGEALYTSMLTSCKKNKMKYSFYNTDTNKLYLDKNKECNSIYHIVGKIDLKPKNFTLILDELPKLYGLFNFSI